jgi:hypothetical protein
MAFFRNDAINRVNMHSAVLALAQASGGVFFFVVLLRAGVPIPVALLAQAGIQAARFALRPAVLPLVKRFGLKPLLVVGTAISALQYPLLALVSGVDDTLLTLCLVAGTGGVIYWVSYNSYFASVGDPAHRGHQISAREALVALANIVGPLMGAWALLALGPGPMLAAVGLIQLASIVPLIGAPNVAVTERAPGAFRAARIGMLLSAADGWLDTWGEFVWLIALYTTLREDVSAYGGAMALAAVVGVGGGLLLGRHIDAGGGRRAVLIAYGALGVVVVVRALSVGVPAMAVVANALGPIAMTLVSPVLGAANYNLAKASPCPMRFNLAAEASWDVGCFFGCLTAAGLARTSLELSVSLLLALPAVVASALVLRAYYARRTDVGVVV